MGKLTIEEKAKRYDEAIDRANSLLSSNQLGNAWIYKLLPELKESKESKDERIRKLLLESFKSLSNACTKNNCYRDDITYKDVIAWFEKQGEHANFRNKIQIGDKVTRNEDGVLVNLSQLNRVAKKHSENNMGISEATKKKLEDNLNRALEKETPESWNKFLDEQGEQKLVDWSEEDARLLDNCISLIEDIDCTKEEQKWLKSLKNKVQPQPKKEWSEEDIETISRVISIVKWAAYSDHSHPILNDEGATELVEWLKSLKERYTWKPSDEQLKLLKKVIDAGYYTSYPYALETLYEQLRQF